MSVDKLIWISKGVEKTARVVDYSDGSATRRLGHASITMTMDTCGPLFPRGDDADEIAAADAAILA
ncbi:MAG: hypothetical protein KKF33_13755 [Alphaproteobacteria bacterium]|nr:hypothetical protein [Alphaproteobacteria bacterium]